MLTTSDFDNSASTIMARLLDIYPVDTLRTVFGAEGHSAQMIEQIIKQSPVKELKVDTLRLMGHCRQHVFLFSHKLKHVPSSVFSQNIEQEELVTDEPERKTIEYLLKASYNFFEVKGQSAIQRKSFAWWPVKVVIDKKFLRLHITIAERHTRSSGGFYYVDRSLDEEGIIAMLHGALGPAADLTPVDLNRGLKAIWNEDVIDSKFVTRQGAKSLDTCLMHTGFTFKKDDPARYNDLLADPLKKSIFNVLNDPTLPESFAIEAGLGFVAFRNFTKTPDGIDKLISLILSKN